MIFWKKLVHIEILIINQPPESEGIILIPNMYGALEIIEKNVFCLTGTFK